MRVELRNQQGELQGFTEVDEDTYNLYGHIRWKLDSLGYVVIVSKILNYPRMQRVVLDLRPGDDLEGDHIDGDKLNNLRSNLRAITHQGQCQNRAGTAESGTRNVYYDKRDGYWYAQVLTNGKKYTSRRTKNKTLAISYANELRNKYLPYSIEDRHDDW